MASLSVVVVEVSDAIPRCVHCGSRHVLGMRSKDEFRADDFVRQHLNSIGTEQARAAVKNRAAEGKVEFTALKKLGVLDGPEVLLSEGDKLASQFKFPSISHRTEWFVRDGKKTSVIPVGPGMRSGFGLFVMVHDEILTEGLWGGTLSTGWALTHLDERRAKLEDRGMKNVNGRQLRRIDYVPKKTSDLVIQLYFEPDTFRHVMTVYTIESNRAALLRLEERFSDFKKVDDLTLPTRWFIEFTSGEQYVSRYDIIEEKISHNTSLDPKNFEVR
jgi:hypothetical protein